MAGDKQLSGTPEKKRPHEQGTLKEPPGKKQKLDPEENNAQVLKNLAAAVGKPMAKLSPDERNLLIAVINEKPLPGPHNPSDQTKAELRDKVAARREKLHLEPMPRNWAELLEKDGFDPTPISNAIIKLKAKEKGAEEAGYEFQIMRTLVAWSEYRLCGVEVHLKILEEYKNCFIDAIEWAHPGKFEYCEYKAYSKYDTPSQGTKIKFVQQLNDYQRAAERSSVDNLNYVFKYVFAYGVPAWTQEFFNKSNFPHGLYVTDLKAPGSPTYDCTGSNQPFKLQPPPTTTTNPSAPKLRTFVAYPQPPKKTERATGGPDPIVPQLPSASTLVNKPWAPAPELAVNRPNSPISTSTDRPPLLPSGKGGSPPQEKITEPGLEGKNPNHRVLIELTKTMSKNTAELSDYENQQLIAVEAGQVPEGFQDPIREDLELLDALRQLYAKVPK
ncbi:MAG: hypothetical protein JWN52_5381 [Actinomycetia bacterium]|nr:hypothetical protein [Actinomycetes bacterium]